MKKQRGNPPAVQPQQQAHMITEIREYMVITALTGGGAITNEPDAITVIRGTEIRGQLRFWWRACYGGRYQSIDKMKQAEEQIWGAANRKSASSPEAANEKDASSPGSANEKGASGPGFTDTIQILIEPIEKGIRVEYARADIPTYAAFPLRPIKGEPPKSVYKNVRFRLSISFPKQRPEHDHLERDIQGTLWAWETFGGVGARTRRGFGALKLDKTIRIARMGGSTEKPEEVENTLPPSSGTAKWIAEKFAEFGIDQKAPKGVPSLSKNMQIYFYVKNNLTTTYRPWHDLVGALSLFRQDRDWPDKRDIKVLKEQWESPVQQTYNFPKAALGLPIVYYFPREDNKDEFTLQGKEEGHDRLASSLILRPLECQDGQTIGLVILLENYPHHPEDIQMLDRLKMLKKVDGKPQDLPITIETKVAAQGVRVLAGEKDILKAFMNYLKRGQWQRELENIRGNSRQSRNPQNNNNQGRNRR